MKLYYDGSDFGELTGTLEDGVFMISMCLPWFVFFALLTRNPGLTNHIFILNLFMTIIQQRLWVIYRQVFPNIPCAPISTQRRPFCSYFHGALSYFSILQTIKWKQPKICLLKILENLQIQTQELMLPHKNTEVCTVHNVLRLLGPLPLFQSDTLRDGGI